MTSWVINIHDIYPMNNYPWINYNHVIIVNTSQKNGVYKRPPCPSTTNTRNFAKSQELLYIQNFKSIVWELKYNARPMVCGSHHFMLRPGTRGWIGILGTKVNLISYTTKNLYIWKTIVDKSLKLHLLRFIFHHFISIFTWNIQKV